MRSITLLLTFLTLLLALGRNTPPLAAPPHHA